MLSVQPALKLRHHPCVSSLLPFLLKEREQGAPPLWDQSFLGIKRISFFVIPTSLGSLYKSRQGVYTNTAIISRTLESSTLQYMTVQCPTHLPSKLPVSMASLLASPSAAPLR